jgi:hypothetical protein
VPAYILADVPPIAPAAIKASCADSEAGFGVFDAWSQKWPGYDAAATREAWTGFKPTRTGFGKLEALAWEANPNWRDNIKAEPEPSPATTSSASGIKDDAKSAKQTDLEEWDAGELLCGPLPPPRQWLTARQFCRGFVSSCVAPGGIGKTTLRLTQAIELATGRSLLGSPTNATSPSTARPTRTRVRSRPATPTPGAAAARSAMPTVSISP